MISELFQATAQAEYEKSLAQITRTKDPLIALEKSYQRHTDLIASTTEHSTEKPACRAGCGFCCYYKVEAQAHEIFLVKDYIVKHFTSEKVAQLIEALEVNARIIRSVTPEQHLTTNIKCVLLENDQCSVYSARPFRCRNAHSTDMLACETSFNSPADMNLTTGVIESLAVAADAHTQGFEAAVQQTGRDTQVYDYTTALLEALTTNSPSKRYQKGKTAFLSAVKVSN